jgi:hypothetical protein
MVGTVEREDRHRVLTGRILAIRCALREVSGSGRVLELPIFDAVVLIADFLDDELRYTIGGSSVSRFGCKCCGEDKLTNHLYARLRGFEGKHDSSVTSTWF